MTSQNPKAHRIIVGYDGSQSARAALRYAVSKVGGGKLVVVHVYGPSVAMNDGNQKPFGEQRTYHQALLAELADASGSNLDGIDFELEPVRGSPASVLADLGGRYSADEIVVGSPSLRNAAALASSLSRLLEIADRPVVVVPANRNSCPSLEPTE